MKFKLFLILFLSSFLSQSQTKEEIKDFFWGKNDAYKSANTIPEKYKNESAVIIYKNQNFDYHKFGKSVTFISSYRKRIKLLDQAAVKEFSEFSYDDKFISSKGSYSLKTSTLILGVKVIKPDGKEIEINVEKEAVKEDKSKKIAVSNLEVNDIIDFYVHITEPFKSFEQYGFDPVETTLGETYPILDLKLTFNTENDFFVNFESYNGAPKLKQIDNAKGSERKYELVAKDVAKNDFPRWFLPLVEMPCYKFQVFFARSGKFEKLANAFLSEKESVIKSKVSKEDVYNYYDSKFKPSGDIGDIENFLKGKSFKNDEEKVKEVYYFCRHKYYTRYVEAFVIDEAKIMYPYELFESYPIFFTYEEQFINFFMQYLKSEKISFDIIIATERENGPISDILIQSNAKVLLKVQTENPLVFGFFTPYTTPDIFNANIENTKAFALKVSNNKKVNAIEEIILPKTTYKDNITISNTTLSINPEFNKISINRDEKLFGHNKEFEIEDRVNFIDFAEEDYKKYGTTPVLDLVKNKKKKEQYKKEYDALLKKVKDNQLESFKQGIENEFGFKIEDLKYELVNTGRFDKNNPLNYKAAFTISNELIKKAGSNYILEIGKFITSQVEIEEKEKNRSNNIYSIFPRTFEYNVILEIPTGYTVTGIEKLNKSIENETGGFISSAIIKDNQIIIKANKFYKNNYEPAGNWAKMVAFLNLSYQFTQEKILFKKN